MKRKTFSAAFALALLTISCGDTSQKTSELPVIDMNATYPEKEICLQDVAEVSYIPLETTDDFLFSGTLASVDERGIAVNNQDGSVLVFTGDGKVVSSFNRKGQGPEDYIGIAQLVVDWDKQEVFVLEHNKVQVYSLEGTFKRTLKMNGNVRRDFYAYSDESIVCFRTATVVNVGQGYVPYDPLVVKAKDDGEEEIIPWLKTNEKQLMLEDSDMRTVVYFPSIHDMGGEIYVNDVACDTIFLLDKSKELKPLLTRVPTAQTIEEVEKYLLLGGVTSRYYFLSLIGSKYPLNSFRGINAETQNVAYDRQSGEIYQVKFTNKEDASRTWIPGNFIQRTNVKNVAITPLQAHHLTEALEEGKLSGELKTIAEGLKEDDNPVLMVVKFKE